MSGFSEVLQTMGAIIIFSLILLTSNRMILSNTIRQVESEAEGIAVTLAQNIIEEAQTKAFDENTTAGNIPFNTPADFSVIYSEEGNNHKYFDDFDDFDGYTETIDTELGEDSFTLNVDVVYVSASDSFAFNKGTKNTPTHFKKMRISVTSDYLDNNNQKIQLEYLYRYFKGQN